MKPISLKLPDELLRASTRVAEALGLTRSEYIRRALEVANRAALAKLRAARLRALSQRVRQESMRVNAAFEAVSEDPDA